VKRLLILVAATMAAFFAIASQASARQASGAVPGGMARVEGGTFLMGYCPGGRSVTPMREVTVSGFYMGRFPVTQGEWYDVMGSNPSHFQGDMVPADANWRNLPVESVSWLDAVEFANARSLRAGLTPAYAINGTGASRDVTWNRAANGYRLPTEAEWEFAARGGIVCQGNFVFSGSNTAGEVAWYWGNSGGRTREVGTLRPNALGLYDMSGNVWEWVWDWHGPYPSVAQTDPAGASSGSDRMIRGGCWSSSAFLARSAQRNSVRVAPSARSLFVPSIWSRAIGFRLVRSAD